MPCQSQRNEYSTAKQNTAQHRTAEQSKAKYSKAPHHRITRTLHSNTQYAHLWANLSPVAHDSQHGVKSDGSCRVQYRIKGCQVPTTSVANNKCIHLRRDERADIACRTNIKYWRMLQTPLFCVRTLLAACTPDRSAAALLPIVVEGVTQEW